MKCRSIEKHCADGSTDGTHCPTEQWKVCPGKQSPHNVSCAEANTQAMDTNSDMLPAFQLMGNLCIKHMKLCDLKGQGEDSDNTRKGRQQYDLKGQGSIQISGGSRIFPKGCANSQIGIILPIFCRKLHENERTWTPRGRVPDAHPPDPPMQINT